MGGSTKKTTSNETAVTQPNTPAYAVAPITNYYGQVDDFGTTTDPHSLVAPADPLQTQAATAASNFAPNPLFAQAAAATQLNGQAPQAATPTTPSLFQTSVAALPTAQQAAWTPASATGYTAPTLGNAAQVNTPTLGNAQTYTPSLLGNATQATGNGYTAPQLGQAAQAGLSTVNAAQAGPAVGYDVTQAQNQGFNSPVHTANAESLLTGFNNYLNPATQALVDTTLQGFDQNATQQRLAQAADAARNGAFSGSRYGIQAAQTEQGLAQARAATEAGLRNTAWNNAAGLSQYDTTNRQNTGFFNAGAANTRDELAAQLNQQTGLFNAGALNDRGQFVAGAQNNINLANAGFQQNAGLANAAAANQNAQFNTGQANQFGLSQADLNAAASQFGANAGNQASLFNAGAQNQFGLANQGAQNEAAQFGAGAQNQFSLANASNQLQAGQFNAGQTNQFALSQADLQAQAAAAQAAAQNAANAQNAQLGTQTSQFNTGQANNFASQLFEAQNAANSQNTQAGNALNSQVYGTQAQTNQFNAGQQQQQQQINNAAAGQLAQIGGQQSQQQLAQTALQGDIGAQMQAISQMDAQSRATFLAQYGQLLNPSVLQAVTGQTITSNGTSTTKSSGGLLGTLAGIASIGGALIPSDRRLKRNVVKVGEMPDTLGVYEYDYIWPGPRQRGVMADEVSVLRPWALGPAIGGYATVNYAEL